MNKQANSSEMPNETEETIRETIERSATTMDIPSFGWSSYAERMNGRFAMIGFVGILLVEAFSNSSFLTWAGFIN